MKKELNAYAKQRQVLKNLAEGGPGSTRWGGHTLKDKESQGRYLKGKLNIQADKAVDPVKAMKISGRIERVNKAMDLNRLKAKADANSVRAFGSYRSADRNQRAFAIRAARVKVQKAKQGLRDKARANSVKKYGSAGARDRGREVSMYRALRKTGTKRPDRVLKPLSTRRLLDLISPVATK